MTGKQKTALLASAALAALLAGVWLVSAPALERGRMLEQQSQLVKKIEQGDGQLALKPDTGLSFYEEPGVDVVSVSPQAAPTTAPAPEPAPEPAAPEVAGGIGILTIDRIDAVLPVTDGATGAQLKIAEGWVPQTATIGGMGNAVIAGHRSYTYGVHFNRLGELTEGDVIQYDPIDGEHMEFTVTEILTVEPGDPAIFAQPEDAAMLTLYTCTPIRTATHRLLVRAERTI